MKNSILIFFILSTTIILNAQKSAKDNLPVIELESKSEILETGNLKDGSTIPLKWAESSQVACFPGTRFNEFQGNHILYRVQLPSYSQIKITVKPKDKKDRINVYALRLGVDNMDTPPNIFRAGSCEAAYPIYAGKPNYRKSNKAQSVELMSIRNPYSILIGVAGAVGVKEGEYELEIELLSKK